MGLIFIKLGGSLITDKRSSAPTPNVERIELIADDLAAIARERKLLLANGAGSFGHPLARKYRISEGLRGNELGVSETCLSVDELNRLVVRSLVKRGVPAISVSPRSMVYKTSEGFVVFKEAVLMMIERGLVPVMYGDVVCDQEKGVTIFSGDDVPLQFVEKLDTAIFLVDVPGVLDAEGKLIRKLRSAEVMTLELESPSLDVTGGMKKKLSVAGKLAGRGVRVIIAGFEERGDLIRILNGEKGTLIA